MAQEHDEFKRLCELATEQFGFPVEVWMNEAFRCGTTDGYERARLKYGNNSDFNPIFKEKDPDEDQDQQGQ